MKMFRFLRCFCFLIVVLLLQACKCGSITCPALEAQYADWLPYKNGDIITFTNSAGKEVRFTGKLYQVSQAQSSECRPIGILGCKCDECPQPGGEVLAQTADTTWSLYNAQGQNIKVFNLMTTTVSKPKTDEGKITAAYSIFDHQNTVQIGPTLQVNQGDSLLPSYTVGNRTYTNVIVHQADTAHNPNSFPNVYIVSKSYYNKAFGLIAFYDLKTRSLFYRKP